MQIRCVTLFFSFISLTGIVLAAQGAPALVGLPIFVKSKQVDYRTREIDGQVYVPVALLSGPLGIPVAVVDGSVKIAPGEDPDTPRPVLVVTDDDFLSALLAREGVYAIRKTTLPPDIKPFAAVWIASEHGIPPNRNKDIEEYVAAGGGLVLNGLVPVAIAGPANVEVNRGITEYRLKGEVADWFGADFLRGGAATAEVKLPSKPFGRSIRYAVGSAPIERHSPIVSPNSRFARSMSDVPKGALNLSHSVMFTHTYGKGRVYWQYSIDTKTNYPDLPVLAVEGVRWAAQMR